jgi:hypothetical protein
LDRREGGRLVHVFELLEGAETLSLDVRCLLAGDYERRLAKLRRMRLGNDEYGVATESTIRESNHQVLSA